jgi:hypothetical protein
MAFPQHLVLNIGGPHGTPALVDDSNFVSSRPGKRLAASRKKRAKLKASDHWNVGDVLFNSWGYDHINVDWYQVVEVKSKSIVIRPLARNYREIGLQCGISQPSIDALLSWRGFQPFLQPQELRRETRTVVAIAERLDQLQRHDSPQLVIDYFGFGAKRVSSPRLNFVLLHCGHEPIDRCIVSNLRRVALGARLHDLPNHRSLAHEPFPSALPNLPVARDERIKPLLRLLRNRQLTESKIDFQRPVAVAQIPNLSPALRTKHFPRRLARR